MGAKRVGANSPWGETGIVHFNNHHIFIDTLMITTNSKCWTFSLDGFKLRTYICIPFLQVNFRQTIFKTEDLNKFMEIITELPQ